MDSSIAIREIEEQFGQDVVEGLISQIAADPDVSYENPNRVRTVSCRKRDGEFIWMGR